MLQDLGAIANPMFKGKGPAMLQNNYSPAFPLKHQQKDMRLALALGDENSVPMPVAAASNEVFLFFQSLLAVFTRPLLDKDTCPQLECLILFL